jgi:hypothetical protein
VDERDTLGKRPHRILAERLGVPHSVAYRTKVPAQDGASIHTLLERIAAREPGLVVGAGARVPDFGSNYRYRDAPGAYGTPLVRAYLAKVVERGGFVVANADGTADVESRRIEVAAPLSGKVHSPL